jgi:hypothetical protein
MEMRWGASVPRAKRQGAAALQDAIALRSALCSFKTQILPKAEALPSRRQLL